MTSGFCVDLGEEQSRESCHVCILARKTREDDWSSPPKYVGISESRKRLICMSESLGLLQ